MVPSWRLLPAALLLAAPTAALMAEQPTFVERRLERRWEAPQRVVSLPDGPISLAQAAAALSRLGAYRVIYQGMPRTVQLDVKKLGFWQALTRICDQAGLEFNHWSDRRITLVPGRFRLAGMARVGPYLVVMRAPVRLSGRLHQFRVTLDRLQFSSGDGPLELGAAAWKVRLADGSALPIRPVERREDTWRRDLVFQVTVPDGKRLAGLAGSLPMSWPTAVRSGRLPLTGKRAVRDAATGLQWRAGGPEKVWGGWRLALTATGERVPALARVGLIGEKGKSVAAELAFGGTGKPARWTLRFPDPGGRPVALALSYYAGTRARAYPVSLGGLGRAPAPAPARRVTGRIQVLAPPARAGRLEVGFRSEDDWHQGSVAASIDLAALATRPAAFRETDVEGFLQWSGTQVRYQLDRLRPGPYQLWVRYRRNLIAAGRVVVPKAGEVRKDWVLDCRQTVEFRARFVRPAPRPGKKVEVLRVFFIPLAADGSPALSSYRDAVTGRIEKDGSVVLPLMGLGRYRVLAFDESDSGTPRLVRARFTVDRKTRPVWSLPGR